MKLKITAGYIIIKLHMRVIITSPNAIKTE